MILFKTFMISLLCTLTRISAKDFLIKRAITPYQPSNPNGQPSNPAQPNEQTNVNQAIRIREPVDRPPELPATHLIQYHEPSPRHERPSMWQRLRGNRGNQENSNKDKDKGKGKMNEKEENQSSVLGKRKKPEGGTHDNEAGTSGTKPVSEPESKKNKGFWKSVWEGSGDDDDDDRRRRRRRYNNYYKTKEEKERDAKAGEALLGIIGSAVYGVYQGTKAVVEGVYNGGKYVGNKVKEGCNAACRAAKNKAKRVKNTILRRPNPVNDNSHHQHQPLLSSSSSDSRGPNRSRHSNNFSYPQHYIQYNHPVPQPSLSTHSASHFGATISNERSVNQYRGHDRGAIIARSSDSGGSRSYRSHSVNAHTQTSSSSSSSASSMSISSRSASPTHSSGTSVSRGSSSIRRHLQQHPGQ